jgi:hypothetical protein
MRAAGPFAAHAAPDWRPVLGDRRALNRVFPGLDAEDLMDAVKDPITISNGSTCTSTR